MNQHFFENAPDGAWDDSVFSPLPSEGRAFIAPPSALVRRWPLVVAGMVVIVMAVWSLKGVSDESAEPVADTAAAPVFVKLDPPAPPPAPRIAQPTKRKQPAVVATKPAVKNVEVNPARNFGPTP